MNVTGSKRHCATQVLDPSAVLAAMEQSLAMIEFNIQGKVLWANDNFARAMGYEAAEMPGMLHRQFCTAAFVNSREYAALWDNLKSGRPFQEKILRVSKHGRHLWFEATYTPVFDDAGQVQAVLKVAADITSRENARTQVTNELQQMAATLLRRAEAGISSSYQIAAAMDRVVKESDANMQALQLLESKAEAVQGMIRMIRDIASQTHLLALNAAIEAAHAGEHGLGFNIVAREVRKLAKQAEDAAQEMSSQLEGIAKEVTTMGKGTKQSQNVLADSQHRVQTAVDEFMGIGQAARELDQQAQSLGEWL